MSAADGPEDVKPKEPFCVMGCRQDLKACLATVRAEASGCFAGCKDEGDAVRATCAGAADSPECAAARQSAAHCLEPCRSSLGARVHVCLSSEKECTRVCPAAHDVECVRDCADGQVRCVEAALIQLRFCELEACSAEYEAARQACVVPEGGPPLEECVAVREALEPCLDLCRQAFRESSMACDAPLRGCFASCATI